MSIEALYEEYISQSFSESDNGYDDHSDYHTDN